MNGFSAVRVMRAFLRRDLLAAGPWALVSEWLDVVLAVVAWYFIARFVARTSSGSFHGMTDYFTFSLVGLALSQCVWRGYHGFVDRVKSARGSGSLERFWLAACPFSLSLLSWGLWGFLIATVNASLTLALGAFCFGAHLRWDNILAILGVGLLASLAMGCIGLLASSWFLFSGRGDGFRPLFSRMIPILCGAFFPISVLPGWLQRVAWCFPLTHAFVLARGIRSAPTAAGLVPNGTILIGMTLLLAFAGWISIHLALRQARINGRIATG